MIIWKEFTFDSAHQLKNTPKCDYGKCANVHGHTYILQVGLEGDIDSKTHMIMNFADLKKIVNEEIVDRFDHTMLNESMKDLDIDQNHTTCERMAYMFQRMLERRIIGKSYPNVFCIRIKLWETPTSYCEI